MDKVAKCPECDWAKCRYKKQRIAGDFYPFERICFYAIFMEIATNL